jgi:hypothetical protein
MQLAATSSHAERAFVTDLWQGADRTDDIAHYLPFTRCGQEDYRSDRGG